MNKLLFPDGGMPLYGDDLGWQFESILDGLVGIARGFGIDGRCVFWGCEVTLTASSVSITEGWVLQGDGLLYLAEQTISGITGIKLQDVFLQKSEVLNNPTLMEDGQTENIYKTVTGVIKYLPGISQPYDFALDVIDDYRLENILHTERTGSLTLVNGFTVSFGSGMEVLKVGRLVTLNGSLTGTVVQGGDVIGVLPSGFYPIRDTYFLCHAGVNTFVEIRVAPNGNIYADGTGGNNTIGLNFSYLA